MCEPLTIILALLWSVALCCAAFVAGHLIGLWLATDGPSRAAWAIHQHFAPAPDDPFAALTPEERARLEEPGQRLAWAMGQVSAEVPTAEEMAASMNSAARYLSSLEHSP